MLSTEEQCARSTVLMAVGQYINQECGFNSEDTYWRVFDANAGLDDNDVDLVAGLGSRNLPSIYISRCYNVKPNQYRFCFTYGHDYYQHLYYYGVGCPNTEINVGKQKTLDSIRRDVYKRLFAPCWKYFSEQVKPSKDSSDNSQQKTLERLMKLHAVVRGRRTPVLGQDRIDGEYNNQGGHARDIRAGSNSIDMNLCSIPMDKAIEILKLVYTT